EMARACGLEQVLYRRIEELSKGYRQRVGLAASMLHDPQCLILDEPTTGLDPNQIIEIRHLIRRLGEQKTVLLSSHILPEVEAVCDRMMIIDKGELQALGTSEELSKQAQAGTCVLAVVKGNADKLLTHLQSVLPDTMMMKQEPLPHGNTQIEVSHPEPDCNLAEQLFLAAVAKDVVLLEMRHEQASLEDVFRELTGGNA
ncbi:MAG: ATP-binding cassette domain-containing protein, partial [Ghiorsea sp.]|nr:ATP-binding cassette domain-containing protein [Ghiorsea sp.]